MGQVVQFRGAHASPRVSRRGLKDRPVDLRRETLASDRRAALGGLAEDCRDVLRRDLPSAPPHADLALPHRQGIGADGGGEGADPSTGSNRLVKGEHLGGRFGHRGSHFFNHDRDCDANTNVMQPPGPITTVKTIAERLAHAREKIVKISQGELALRAGVKQSTIGNIEAGLRKSPRELLAIARAAGVNPEWLKSGKGPMLATGEAETQPVLDLDAEALLRDMRDAMASPRLARKLAELRADVAEMREFARNVYSVDPIEGETNGMSPATPPPRTDQLLNAPKAPRKTGT